MWRYSYYRSLLRPVPLRAFAFILHSPGTSTKMSAFDMFAQANLEALGETTQLPPGNATAPTIASTDSGNPFETHLIIVSARLDELKLLYHGNRMAIGPQVMALGDALRGLALVAFNQQLSLRDEAATALLDALQWVN
jgi:hypothetical protein